MALRTGSLFRFDSTAQPSEQTDSGSTWIVRAQNFLVTFSQVRAGFTLKRENCPEESFLLLLGMEVELTCGNARATVAPRSICLLPPGDHTVRALGAGSIAEVFAPPPEGLAGRALNASDYSSWASQLRPLPQRASPPRTEPRIFAADGEKRPYYQAAKLMVSWSERLEPRDITNMSPHSHADFEQGSLVLDGSYVHHLRVPWGKDMRDWRHDEHVTCGPSLLVIPPNLIHTSQAMAQRNLLCDIFAPPRDDFISQGLVANADDYR